MSTWEMLQTKFQKSLTFVISDKKILKELSIYVNVLKHQTHQSGANNLGRSLLENVYISM